MLTVKPADHQRCDVDTLDASRIDGDRRRILRRCADHRDAACWAIVLSTGRSSPDIGAEQPAWVHKLHFFRRDIPVKKPAPHADRTIALDDLAKFCGNLQLNIPAVTRQFDWSRHRDLPRGA